MKLYVSLPMTNREDTVLKRFNEAVNTIKNDPTLSKYEIVEPYKLTDMFDENGLIDEASFDDDALGYFMGQDITLVMGSDAIYMCEGWENSRGCKAEKAVAEIYDIDVVYA